MSEQVEVALTRKGPKVDINFEGAGLGKISLDISSLPEDEKHGGAKRLLGESALFCFIGSLDKALETRGAVYEEIRGKASVKAGANEKNQSRILGIHLDVVVRMDSDYEEIFERVSKVLKNGCLVTASLDAAFPVTYNLELECPDD